jgi:hypothetical protein
VGEVSETFNVRWGRPADGPAQVTATPAAPPTAAAGQVPLEVAGAAYGRPWLRATAIVGGGACLLTAVTVLATGHLIGGLLTRGRPRNDEPAGS